MYVKKFLPAYDGPKVIKPMTDARETRTRNLHEIEHALFDARNSREKYLAASRYHTRTSFSRELTRTSFSYVCHGLNNCDLPWL